MICSKIHYNSGQNSTICAGIDCMRSGCDSSPHKKFNLVNTLLNTKYYNLEYQALSPTYTNLFRTSALPTCKHDENQTHRHTN